MITDARVQKLARLLVAYSVEIKEKQKVIISGTTASESLIREIYKETLLAGAYPRVKIGFQEQEYLFYSLAQDHQIQYTDPFDLYEMENLDALIAVFPDFNPHALTSIDSEKKQKHILENSFAHEALFDNFYNAQISAVSGTFTT